MKLGILQGRLSPPVEGLMQEFPSTTWKNEFSSLPKCDLEGIEWIITNTPNPFFTEDLSKFPILSICVDNIISPFFTQLYFLEQELVPVLEKMESQTIKNIVIPLLEESSIVSSLNRKLFIKNILLIADKFSNVNFCFEFECKVEDILKLVNQRDNFYVTYDTGNVTSFYGDKVNHNKLIKQLGDKIKNVHIKDRTFKAETVPFTLGDTNFVDIFSSLNSIGYTGNYILQLCREKSNNELDYIKHCSYIVKKLHNESI